VEDCGRVLGAIILNKGKAPCTLHSKGTWLRNTVQVTQRLNYPLYKDH
jgi:hypothetical protein